MDFKKFDDIVFKHSASAFPRNGNISIGPLALYYRIAAFHVVEGECVRTLDLANFAVKESERNKGIFSQFLKHAEKIASDSGLVLYVENIHSDILREMLKRRNYTFSDCGMHAWPKSLEKKNV